jgi:hypothetical protein
MKVRSIKARHSARWSARHRRKAEWRKSLARRAHELIFGPGLFGDGPDLSPGIGAAAQPNPEVAQQALDYYKLAYQEARQEEERLRSYMVAQEREALKMCEALMPEPPEDFMARRVRR